MFLTFDPSSLRYLRAALATACEAATLSHLDRSEAYDIADAILVFGRKSDYPSLRAALGDVGERPLTSHALYVAAIAASYALNRGLSSTDTRALICGALFHNVGDHAGGAGEDGRSLVGGHDLLVASGITDAAVLAIARLRAEPLHGWEDTVAFADRRVSHLVRIAAVCNSFARCSEWQGVCPPLSGRALIAQMNAIIPFYLDPLILFDVAQMTLGGAERRLDDPPPSVDQAARWSAKR